MKWVRNLYDWVLSWAETPYGGVALFLLAVAESSFFPIPPDVLLVALCVGKRAHALRFALICTIGSVIGGIIGYGIGWGAWTAVDQIFYNFVPGFTEAKFNSVGDLYEQYNFWVVFIAAFTPIPYKVITIAAGVFQIAFPMFVVASVIGRAARFYLVAGLLYHYGEPIKGFIDKWFNLLVVVFTVLLVGGFALLKYAH